MSIREQMNAVTGSLVSDTGLLAEAFTLTDQDTGQVIEFKGTLSGLEVDDVRDEVVLHVPVSAFAISPTLMDTVIRESNGMSFDVREVHEEAGVYRIQLGTEERVQR